MLTRYPFALTNFSNVRDEFDRAFASLLRGSRPAAGAPVHGTFPAINFWETEDVVFAEAEVPGLTMKDIDVSIERGELSVAATRAVATPKDALCHRRERPTGDFKRTITLPTIIEVDQVSAELADGVLTIRMPKAAAAKPRKIAVKELK